MLLDATAAQRLRSHGAALDFRAFDLTDRFFETFFASCPHLRAKFPGLGERGRNAMARRWAWFVRNVQSLERVSPELEALGGYLRARGLSGEDFRVAASCLLEATRRTAGGAGIGWNGELEADWAAAIERVTGLMNPARRLALPMAA